MKHLKPVLSFILAFCLSSWTFAESTPAPREQFASALSGLRLTSAYTNAYNLYNMDRYSRNSYGGAVGFEYTLLPEISKKFDLGFYSRAAFQDFVPCNIQLAKLYSYSFSSGMFAQWNLENELSFFISAGGGFLISDIDFVSAEKGKINDIYYDFMLETDLSFRKEILRTGKISLLGSAGCHVAFYNEKTEHFMNMGPSYGIIIDFNPFGSKK